MAQLDGEHIDDINHIVTFDTLYSDAGFDTRENADFRGLLVNCGKVKYASVLDMNDESTQVSAEHGVCQIVGTVPHS